MVEACSAADDENAADRTHGSQCCLAAQICQNQQHKMLLITTESELSLSYCTVSSKDQTNQLTKQKKNTKKEQSLAV